MPDTIPSHATPLPRQNRFAPPPYYYVANVPKYSGVRKLYLDPRNEGVGRGVHIQMQPHLSVAAINAFDGISSARKAA